MSDEFYAIVGVGVTLLTVLLGVGVPCFLHLANKIDRVSSRTDSKIDQVSSKIDRLMSEPGGLAEPVTRLEERTGWQRTPLVDPGAAP